MLHDASHYVIFANQKGRSLCPVPVITRHVAMRTCVRILTGPVTTGHWTEAKPNQKPFHLPIQNTVLNSKTETTILTNWVIIEYF